MLCTLFLIGLKIIKFSLQEISSSPVYLIRKLKTNFKKLITDSKTERGTPTYVTNFDTQLEHLIPEYTKILSASLYENVEKRLLAGLGLIDILESTGSSSRRESILNPKPFIAETENGIKDFINLLSDVIATIKIKNIDKHRKYMNEDITLHYPPVKQFITDSLRDHFRSAYDRGLLSKRTYTEVIGNFDLDIELKRRISETEENLDKALYPPILTNNENSPADLTPFKTPIKKEVIPDDKKGPEAKNFQGKLKVYLVKCKKCNNEFDYENTQEKSMGVTSCPHCSQNLTDEDIDFIKH